jgi:hypothetical protein
MPKKNLRKRKMQMIKSKTLAILIVIILSTSMIAMFDNQQTASAHTPPWQIKSWAYIAVAPNPIGVGQTVSISMWVDAAMPSATVLNDIRRHDYKLTILKPDGTTETKNWPVLFDTTGVQSTLYTPQQVGTYTFNFDYPGQTYTWTGTYQNDVFLPANASATIMVRQESVTEAPTYPLPAEYWTRPIEGENVAWWTIASNWLGTSSLSLPAFQKDGLAPNSAHILWTKPIQFGGIVGGNNSGGVDGGTYYNGLSYETKFTSPLIIQGRLYYPLPKSNNVAGEGYVCIDLQTGEQYWWQNFTVNPSFAQLEWYDSPNQHGVISNGYLWATSGTTWMAYDPIDASWLFNVTDVPTGTTVYGPSGEILRYVLNAQQGWLAMWNFTKIFDSGQIMTDYRPIGKSLNASAAYSWNVSITKLPSGTSINRVIYDDLVLLTQGNFGAQGNSAGANVTTISIKSNSRGQTLWQKYYAAAPDNITRSISAIDPVNHVFILNDKETMQWLAYSLDNGNLLWGPVGSARPWDYFSTTGYVAYGKLYYAGYGGVMYCYDTKNGDLLWTYGNGGTGNSTFSAHETPWGYYPLFVGVIADDKVYMFTTEHSPNSPQYKGSRIRALNATTGEEIWTLLGWGNPGSFTASGFAVADGCMVYLNTYDMQIYNLGKGPSAITLSTQNDIISQGSSILLKGTVTDISAGTKQTEQVARFPSGVPAVSDSSMPQWMEYVYMQKPLPTDTTGIPITLSVVDANGNYREIGSATSDSDGFYSFKWTPDIEGKYTVYASFGGSESYWPSHAVTAFAVDPAAPTPAPTSEPLQSVADMYFVPAIAGLFVLVIVVAIVLALLMLRKRP